jgi:hypothetical protein
MSATTLTLRNRQQLSANPTQNFKFTSGNNFSNWEFLPPKQPEHKPSKQLNYYYRHKQERLIYQQFYYNQHKNTILTTKHHRDYLLKVKRTEKNNTLLRLMSIKSHSVLRKEAMEEFNDAFNHHHGRPNLKRQNSRYALPKTKMWFHAIPKISIIERDQKVIYRDRFNSVLYKDAITARELTIQQAHFLGLKLGDSIVWKELNRYTHKIETHTVCFDRSGLDSSHESNLPSLVACSIETGRKGLDLLSAFAVLHSLNGYIQVWRGNKLLLTSERENALRQWVKTENLSEYYPELKNVINDYPKEILKLPKLT